ncbi:hypothetical protein D3C73_1668940 [compost metagenome]
MDIDRTFLQLAQLIHSADMIEMGMSQENSLHLQILNPPNQGLRIHARVDDDCTFGFIIG